MVTKDNLSVTSRTELIKSLQYEQTKQHIIFDGSSRPIFLFEAISAAEDGDPCLATEYVYLNAGTTVVRTRQERVYKWKAAWESDFIFDPDANYDPDGDGAL